MSTPQLLVLALTAALAQDDPGERDTTLPMTIPVLPAPISVPLIRAQAELHTGSGPTEGLLSMRHELLFQNLGWEPPQGSLEQAVAHEIDLVYQALQRPVPADGPAPAPIAVADTIGLHWEVDGGTTIFVGTSWHCPGHRVEFTSYGPDPELVRLRHAQSLEGARCTAVGGLDLCGE